MITAWDEPSRFTDADAGITAADVAGENLTVTVWPEHDAAGVRWFWVLDKHTPHDDGNGGCEWEDDQVGGGICETREQAEADGETAKADYLRSLTGK